MQSRKKLVNCVYKGTQLKMKISSTDDFHTYIYPEQEIILTALFFKEECHSAAGSIAPDLQW